MRAPTATGLGKRETEKKTQEEKLEGNHEQNGGKETD